MGNFCVKDRHLKGQLPTGVQPETSPVKHLVVLPAHHVEINQRQLRFDHARHHMVQAGVEFAPVIG